MNEVMMGFMGSFCLYYYCFVELGCNIHFLRAMLAEGLGVLVLNNQIRH